MRDNIISHINASISEKQQIFETLDVKKRLNSVIKIMENEASIIGVEKRIRGRVKTQMEKTQREYYLNCLLYTSPSPRDLSTSRMPSSA